MAPRPTFLLLFFILATGVLLIVPSYMTESMAVAAISPRPGPARTKPPSLRPMCKTSNGALIGDCTIDDDDEMGMDSEANRRILAEHKRYISYGALKKNKTPCNQRGQSYYNCSHGGKANPYHRSCTVITKCARSIR